MQRPSPWSKNPLVILGTLVVGILALIVGILYQTEALGHHPTRALAGLVVGALLVVGSLIWWVIGRARSPA